MTDEKTPSEIRAILDRWLELTLKADALIEEAEALSHSGCSVNATWSGSTEWLCVQDILFDALGRAVYRGGPDA